jgi:hypothetical protein
MDFAAAQCGAMIEFRIASPTAENYSNIPRRLLAKGKQTYERENQLHAGPDPEGQGRR